MSAGPRFAHLARLTDDTGLLEHALLTVPRREHGYCVDDVARGLVVTSASRTRRPTVERRWRRYLAFVVARPGRRRAFHNRLRHDGVDRRAGHRGLLGPRAVGARHAPSRAPPDAPTARRRWPPASAALQQPLPLAARDGLRRARRRRGAARCSPSTPAPARLLADAVTTCSSRPTDAGLALARAAAHLRERRPARGAARRRRRLGDDATLAARPAPAGLAARAGDRATGTCPSPRSAAGRAGEPRPGFDQQPIEAAALADACWRAFELTGDPQLAVAAWTGASAWFLGDNDVRRGALRRRDRRLLRRPAPNGRNENQGAESTLAAAVDAAAWRRARAWSAAGDPVDLAARSSGAPAVLRPDPRARRQPSCSCPAGDDPRRPLADRARSSTASWPWPTHEVDARSRGSLRRVRRPAPRPARRCSAAHFDAGRPPTRTRRARCRRRGGADRRLLHARSTPSRPPRCATRRWSHIPTSRPRRRSAPVRHERARRRRGPHLLRSASGPASSTPTAIVPSTSPARLLVHRRRSPARTRRRVFVAPSSPSSADDRRGAASPATACPTRSPRPSSRTRCAQRCSDHRSTRARRRAAIDRIRADRRRQLPVEFRRRPASPSGCCARRRRPRQRHGGRSASCDSSKRTAASTTRHLHGVRRRRDRAAAAGDDRLPHVPDQPGSRRRRRENKGMALFPRRVGGRYLALSRWDRENNALAYSDDCRIWDDGTPPASRARPWELIQLGNCGSPIETAARLAGPHPRRRPDAASTASAPCCSTSTTRAACSAACRRRC